MRSSRRTLVGPLGLAVTLALLAACGGPARSVEDARRQGERPDYAPRIDDPATWAILATEPASHHVARVEVVKFMIDLRDGGRIYFLESERYDSHFEFATAHLGTPGNRFFGGMAFYSREYRRPDRRFIMGSLLHYVDADLWSWELISGDNLAATRIRSTHRALAAHLYFGASLRYHPVSDMHESRVAELGDTLPVVRDAELYAGLRYQPLELGVAYGYLRFTERAPAREALSPRTILVTDEVPDDLPLVAALITSRFQAPLSHVAVLSRNRRTPDMALRGAITSERLRALEGRLVRLTVGATDMQIEEAQPAEAERAWEAMRPREPFSPRLDTERAELLDSCAIRMGDVDRAGAKAANLGEVCGMGEIEIPGGFVVPFHHYAAHLARAGLDRRIAAELADPAFAREPGPRLAALRQAILEAPVDPQLLAAVRARIAALNAPGRLRFRSSTNAEDLPGFNGAGLYDSAIVSHEAGEEEVAAALRQVWASVFNHRAHEEREWYRINHRRVAMAVLIQVSIDDGVANGVAITQNPFDPVRPGVFINVQTMEGSVTGAGSDEIPEQLLVFTYLPARVPEVLSRSSRTGGQPVLHTPEVLRLTTLLERLDGHFVPRFPEGSNAVDVEFLVAGPERRVVIVQARPYAVERLARR